MKYEYQCIKLPIQAEQLQAIGMGVAPPEVIEAVTAMISETMNEHGQNGWRVMQPLVLPVLWFERAKKTARKTK